MAIGDSVMESPGMDLTSRDPFFWYCQMDKATVLTSIESGIIDQSQGRRIARAVREVIQRGASMDTETRPTDYLGVQAMLVDAGGTETSRMHSGRSRQCMLATLHRCLLRDRFVAVFGQLLHVRSKMLDAAVEYSDSLVPAYTNGVQAQPVTMGHLLCGYESALNRSARRMIQGFERLNLSPLGSAALATTRFPLDRRALADRLGFDGCVENAFDAAQLAVVDVGAEVAQQASLVALSLGTFIQDLHAQYHHARPWILLDSARLSSPSTLMPQKRNPVVLNRARLAASKVLGAGFTAALVGHNVQSGMTDYKRDDAAQTLAETLTLLREVSDILDGMRVDEEAAAAELAAEFSTMSELAAYLQEHAGVAYGIGHTFASKLVDHARRNRMSLRELSEEILHEGFAEASVEHGGERADLPMDRDTFLRVTNPATMVENYRGLGGANPEEVKRLLEHSRTEWTQHSHWHQKVVRQLMEAETDMTTEFNALVPH